MARKSPRKPSEKSSIPPSISNRKARHCRICEGRPLKSECSCTRNPDGTRRTQKRPPKKVTVIPSGAPTSEPPNFNFQDLGNGVTSPTLEMQPRSSPLLPLPTPAPPQTWSPAPVPPASPNTPNLQPLPAVPIYQPTGVSSAFSQAVTLAPSNDTHALNALGPVISMPDFDILTPGTSTHHGTPSTDVSHLIGDFGSSGREPDSGEDFDSSSDSETEPRTPTRKKRLYASSANAQLTPEYQKARHHWKRSRAPRKSVQNLYGKVSGSMQGTMPLGILRKRPLKPALIDQASSIQRFGREIRSLFHKAESLSVQTSSYIFIGAQHPNSRKAFVHYSSDRLRADAIKDTEKVVHEFAGVIDRLNAVRKANAEASQRKLHETEKAFLVYKEQARKELEAAQDALYAKDQEAVYLREMLCQTQRHAQAGLTRVNQSDTS